MSRATQARLNLGAARHNLRHARSLAPNTRVMSVIKANAYGHGAITVARALSQDTDAFAVACIEEALELREAGIDNPILLLEGIFQAQEIDIAVQQNLWLTVANRLQLTALETANPATPLHCWLKIDTGMHRLGVPASDAAEYYQRLSDNPAVADIVLCTHFASADVLDSPQTGEQLVRFNEICATLPPAPRSAANSAGILAWPDAHFDWIRPGYMLYGNSPFGEQAHANTEALRPVMTLSAAVIAVRDVAVGDSVGYAANWTAQRPSRVATVSIGYGDGYPRQAGNGTPVMINGQRAPLAGRVSMDMITVDVTDLEQVSVGDEVILWGPELPVAEIAGHAHTIGYELTTRMPARTPRTVSDSAV